MSFDELAFSGLQLIPSANNENTSANNTQSPSSPQAFCISCSAFVIVNTVTTAAGGSQRICPAGHPLAIADNSPLDLLFRSFLSDSQILENSPIIEELRRQEFSSEDFASNEQFASLLRNSLLNDSNFQSNGTNPDFIANLPRIQLIQADFIQLSLHIPGIFSDLIPSIPENFGRSPFIIENIENHNNFKEEKELFIGHLLKSDSFTGSNMNNSSDWSGKLIFFNRGEISFIEKYRRCIANNASVCLVMNNQPGWPLLMRDSERMDIHDPTKGIYCFLISLRDGNLILNRLKSSNLNEIPISIRIRPKPLICSICLESLDMDHANSARLPCKHLFHHDCVVEWIKKRSFCPLGRCPLPAADSENEANKKSREEERQRKEFQEKELHDRMFG